MKPYPGSPPEGLTSTPPDHIRSYRSLSSPDYPGLNRPINPHNTEIIQTIGSSAKSKEHPDFYSLSICTVNRVDVGGCLE